ncbi:hypothetical protein SpiBuddy_2392 [Sphaerochaeta globosa str. Buddy]|uniref:Uncharacterized protein n=1 Tax=Sphaerochaeta globosa (strain ATCC BAA-1886 / DSM 22777 / Buddy) TaxID=158189 RepID=F0RRF4_SPHGB|nr:hypothetical protein SpiBuddy_2392 [Sphaerochaeta globosa str. Buddy]
MLLPKLEEILYDTGKTGDEVYYSLTDDRFPDFTCECDRINQTKFVDMFSFRFDVISKDYPIAVIANTPKTIPSPVYIISLPELE